MNQPGFVDINLDPAVRFTLQVKATVSLRLGDVPATGAIAAEMAAFRRRSITLTNGAPTLRRRRVRSPCSWRPPREALAAHMVMAYTATIGRPTT
jgi:hypothetical protein